MNISEKEFSIMQEIYNNHIPDQRTIASRTGISLGLTNLIIKRLLTKGYIKARQLERKKIQYILTSRGFSNKTKKSHNFTIMTISMIKQLKEKFQKLILKNYEQGIDTFEIEGTNELADIIEIAFKNLSLPNLKYSRIKNSTVDSNTVYIHASSSVKLEKRLIDAIKYLSDQVLAYC
ncbi:MAG: hypothetical protein A2293_13030 [Elusimicrobia bacterium RIFOXYB2_FULL_49_7]|nr:MAG: hypothetical protein A2293_13030 [Elusimicrobia bacterium RIFOXYB2_FULL_49_7]